MAKNWSRPRFWATERQVRSSFRFTLCLSILTCGAVASAIPAAAAPPVARKSCSIGSPNAGTLDGGVPLGPSPYVRIVPFYEASGARWGLPDLVGLINRAARQVARQFPRSVLSAGDLSRRGGGELDRHHSHESGRDADIGFFLQGDSGGALLAERFIACDSAGALAGGGGRFDDARNWALIASLVDDPEVRVSRIFVASPLRARLLKFAESIHAPSELRQRAADTMAQPHGCPPHDDHFHVRIGCPKSPGGSPQGGCVEEVAYIPKAHSRLAAGRVGAFRRTSDLPKLP